MRTMHAAQGPARRVRDIILFVTLGAFLSLNLGCTTWRVTPVTEISEEEDSKLLSRDVRFYLADGRLAVMKVMEVDYPLVRGTLVDHLGSDALYDDAYVVIRDSEPHQMMEIDLRDVKRMEIKRINATGVIVAVTVVTMTAILIVALATDGDGGSSAPAPPPSSGSSCPVLYVQEGDSNHLVGEPYAGAAAASVQRRDMMPLPTFPEGRMLILLANEAHETQYTDFVELVITDHEPGTRAVATHDQQVLQVGEAEPLLRAVDIFGADVTASLSDTDGDLWQTDLSAYLSATPPPMTEELVLSFPRPTPGTHPVLELELGNTYWLDLVMNRFFALMGDRFDHGVEKANRKSSGPRIREWMAREGVDLKVEWQGPDGWNEVGYVSSVGPLALRHVAVPLPSALLSSASAEITLRISGGSGFWKVDQAGLSSARAETAKTQRVSPDILLGDDGSDQRDLVLSTDGRYQILANLGDQAHLEFEVPPTLSGLERSAFFHSNGYYVAHQPIQSARSMSTLKTILDEEGALSRFSLDLYRKYDELALDTPR